MEKGKFRLVEAFIWNSLFVSVNSECEDLECFKDDSGYVLVDGEEGDYGIVKYYDVDNKQLLAIENVCQDSMDYMFTQYGVSVLTVYALNYFKQRIQEITPLD